MTDELKPCPFCGKTDGLMLKEEDYYEGHSLDCTCGGSMSIWEGDEADLRAAWNRRAGGWRSVADALPDGPRDVLAICDGYIEMMSYDKDFGWSYAGAVKAHDPVTHWRELPPPPDDQ